MKDEVVGFNIKTTFKDIHYRKSYPYPKGEQQGWKDCSKNSGVIGLYTPLARRLLVRVQSIFKYAVVSKIARELNI